jgi:signal transduction histidine kinase
MAIALAAAAGIAIEQARLHARVGELALFEDRERIARDLHDRVIQRLFATGLSLQSVARSNLPPEVFDRLNRAVEDLDETVREVRSSIFELHAPRLPGRSLRQEVLAVCAEVSRVLGFEPVVHFDGAIDALADDDISDHLIAVVREALSNVARHARAETVELNLTSSMDRLTLTVVDDGVGLGGGDSGGRGVANMRQRATRFGGALDLEPGPSGGTRLVWSVVCASA